MRVVITRISLEGLVVVLVLSTGCRRSGGGSSAPLQHPQGPLARDEAERYVLELVNRDRANEGLEPLEWDEIAARAGRRHAEDMVRAGFTAHWGSDGSVPEERYSEAGGEHMVQENAACFFDGVARELDKNPIFSGDALNQIEGAFIGERAPNDGHRRNILKPVHNRLGIGLAKPVGVDQPCMAQEFIDAYGEYKGLPRQAARGQAITIAGEVHAPVSFGGVGVGHIELKEPLSAAQLNSTSVYKVAEPNTLYFPAGFKTPKPVRIDGRNFTIDVSLGRQPGRYAISVWGRYPGEEALVMVSLRIITVH